MKNDHLLTPKEASQILRISTARVRSLIYSGAIRASNLSDSARPRMVIRREDLDAFIESRRVEPQGPIRRRRRIHSMPGDRY